MCGNNAAYGRKALQRKLAHERTRWLCAVTSNARDMSMRLWTLSTIPGTKPWNLCFINDLDISAQCGTQMVVIISLYIYAFLRLKPRPH